MFNLQPGQGLGSRPSRILALGLGTPFGKLDVPAAITTYGGGGGAYVPRYDWDDIIADRQRRDILREDQEMIDVIIQMIVSGVFD